MPEISMTLGKGANQSRGPWELLSRAFLQITPHLLGLSLTLRTPVSRGTWAMRWVVRRDGPTHHALGLGRAWVFLCLTECSKNTQGLQRRGVYFFPTPCTWQRS